MSEDIQWSIIRNTSSFLVRRHGMRSFSTEANNLKNLNSRRFSGLVNKRTIGIEAAEDGKGVVLITKKAKNGRWPRKSHSRVELKRGPRKSLNTIRTIIRNNRYRKDLKMAALRRASAILKSQRPVIIRKARSKKD